MLISHPRSNAKGSVTTSSSVCGAFHVSSAPIVLHMPGTSPFIAHVCRLFTENRLMLESLDLFKPDLPAKPKRLWTKKIWKRNESRGLRTRVFCRAADQTDWRPVERPAKSKRSINAAARWHEYKQNLAASAPSAPGAFASVANNKPRFVGQFIGENGLPACPKCAGDSEACSMVQQGCVTRPSYRCKNVACVHEWRVNLCGRCGQPKRGHVCAAGHHAVPIVPSALQVRQRICDIDASAPPADWVWPDEGAAIEVLASATDNEAPFWRPAKVTVVLEDGWVGGLIELPEGQESWPDSTEWVDWFKWDEEGVDWRRVEQRKKRQAVGIDPGAVICTITGQCGSPGCVLPDFHAGPCTSFAVAPGKRTRSGAGQEEAVVE